MTSEELFADTPGPQKSYDPLTPQGFDTKPVKWSTGLNEPLDKLKVEDEVLEAVKEGKEDAKSYQETKEAQDPQTSEEASKVESREEKNRRLRGNPVFIADLRRADTLSNRTCGYCLRRKPLEDFLRGKKDNFCIKCEGK